MPNSNTRAILWQRRFPPRLLSQLLESAQCCPAQDHTGAELERCFRQSDLLSLATQLDEALHGLHGVELDSSAAHAIVRGALNLSHDGMQVAKSAQCEITIWPDWRSVVPIVCCVEPWVRSHPDWHAGNGYLCFVLDDQWRDLVSHALATEGPRNGARYAAQLCLRNTRWLLYRHYIGHRLKIGKWPADWPFWPHSGTGRAEYQNSLRKEKAA